MIEERVVKSRSEKDQAIEDLKKEGFMSSHKISKMLNRGLIYFGDRRELFAEMRELAKTCRSIECVKLVCTECSSVIYWYRSWDIAKILLRLENHSKSRSLCIVGHQRESEHKAYP